MKSKEKYLNWLKLAGFLAVFGLLFYFVKKVFDLYSPEEIKSFLLSFGIWGSFLYVASVTVCTVVSPLTSLFWWPIAVLVYGPWLAAILTWLGSLAGAVINYLIARKFGRPVMEKLISKKGLQLVDKISFDAGLRTLIILRIVPGALFDYVSYAAGLVKLPFWPYFFITAVSSLVYQLVYFVLILGNAVSLLGIPLLILGGYLLAAISILFSVARKKKETRRHTITP